MVIRVAMLDLFDGDRGLMFYKGSYIEASEEFFKRYDKADLAPPAKAFDPKVNYMMKIEEGDPAAAKAPVVAAPVVEAPAVKAEEPPIVETAMTSAGSGALKGRPGRKPAPPKTVIAKG